MNVTYTYGCNTMAKSYLCVCVCVRGGGGGGGVLIIAAIPIGN